MGDVYSLIMIDVPLVYEDMIFFGDWKSFSVVSLVLKRKEGSVRLRSWKTGVYLWVLLAPTSSLTEPTGWAGYWGGLVSQLWPWLRPHNVRSEGGK